MDAMFVGLAVFGHAVLAAHALRGGDAGLCAALSALGLALFSRLGWVRLAGALVLVLGAALWVEAGLSFVRMRQAFDQPWLRLACIMAGLVLASLGGGLWLLSARARAWFHRGSGFAWAQAAAFVLTAGLLLVARAKASVPVLLADRFWPGFGVLQAALLGFYAAWLAGRLAGAGEHRRLRPRIWALFSLVFFAQLGLGLAGFEQFLMTGRLHLPVPALIAAGPVFRGGGLFMPILFCATVLFVGPAWCSHLCYIGAWDDLSSRLRKKGMAPVSGRLAVILRAGTLALVLGAALALRLLGVPGETAALLAAAFGLFGVGVMLFVSSARGVMVHCTLFCPIGLLGNALGRLGPWRMRLGPSCTKCLACQRACRYSALSLADIEAGRPGLSCTLCGDCVDACKHQSMGYHFPGLSPETSRAVFVTLVAALHAAFLGVARI